MKTVKGTADKFVRKIEQYVQHENLDIIPKKTFIRDIIYLLGKSIDENQYYGFYGYKRFRDRIVRQFRNDSHKDKRSTINKEKLRSCPWCGKPPKFKAEYWSSVGSSVFIIECITEDCAMKPKITRFGKNDVGDRWNDRK